MAERIRIQKKVEWAVADMKPGQAFSAADFASLDDADAVNKALSRLAEAGVIRRAMQGIYDIPLKITLLEEDCDPLIPEVARAVARKNGWSIAPCGETALYEIGMGNRPRTDWTYVSDGPKKEYVIGSQKMSMRTVKSREVSGMHPRSALVIQVIRACGRNMSSEQIDTLSSKLTEEERMILRADSRNVTAWIRRIISVITSFRVQKFDLD